MNNDFQLGGKKGSFPILYYAALIGYVGLSIGLIISSLNLDREYQKHRNNPDKYEKPDYDKFQVPVIVFAILLCVCWAGTTFFYTK